MKGFVQPIAQLLLESPSRLLGLGALGLADVVFQRLESEMRSVEQLGALGFPFGPGAGECGLERLSVGFLERATLLRQGGVAVSARRLAKRFDHLLLFIQQLSDACFRLAADLFESVLVVPLHLQTRLGNGRVQTLRPVGFRGLARRLGLAQGSLEAGSPRFGVANALLGAREPFVELPGQMRALVIELAVNLAP